MDDLTQNFALETAACLWEAVLNLRDNPASNPEALALAMSIRTSFHAVGAGEMRLIVVGWTNAVDTAWTAVEDDYEWCFDWDFVPEWIVANIDWSEPGNPVIRPSGSGGEEGGDGGGDDAASQPETPMTYPSTIQATVAPSIIGKVGRLFNGTANDVLNELLQNARRAGATRVDIDRIIGDHGLTLRVRDDGKGISDPAKFLALGDSGWDSDIARSEDPAGMGVFSLAGRNVTVRSRADDSAAGWQVTIPPAAWESADPLPVETSTIERGTEIEIDVPNSWADLLDKAVASVTTYYPVLVYFDGKPQKRADFLIGATAVEEWNGCRIGVFKGHSDTEIGRINFHGLTVPCRLPSLSEVDGYRNWRVRVDIVDAPNLQLVLPARKEMVENEALVDLREACLKAIFCAIAREGHHRLSFRKWQIAFGLGISLPEAAPWLEEWKPQTAESDGDMFGGRVAGEDMIIIHSAPADLEQSLARAIECRPLLGAKPVRSEDDFEGYSWYDALPRVLSYSFRVTRGDEVIDYDGDTEETPLTVESGTVDTIGIELSILTSREPVSLLGPLSVPADLLIIDPSGGDGVGGAIVLRTGDCSIRARELAWLLVAACFCPVDDSDMDCYETQRERAEAEAQFIATNLLHGEDAAIIERVRDAIGTEISWLVPAGRSMSMKVGSGHIDVAFAANDENAGVASA